jgi:hypothetical protein
VRAPDAPKVSPPVKEIPKGGAGDSPLRGSATTGRVSFSYDSTVSDKSQSVSLRSINLSDYPPDRPGKITRFFQDRILLKGITNAAANYGAGHVVDEAFSRIEAHYAKAADRAITAVNMEFPQPEQVMLDFKLAARSKAYDDVMKGRARTLQPGRLDPNIDDVLEYQDALADAIDELDRHMTDAQPIIDDLRQRSQLLRGVANDFEKTFEWIHLHLPILFAYYQSFVLWRARGVFLSLSARVDGVVSLLNSKISGYQVLFERLNQRLAVVDEEVGGLREKADELSERSRRPRPIR